MSNDLRSRALALPPAERAELAHAIMDSLYDDVHWDTGPGWRIEPDPELSSVAPKVAPIIDIHQRRARPR